MSEKEVIYELAYVLRVGESETSLDEALKSHGATVKLKSPVSSIQLMRAEGSKWSGVFPVRHFQ